MLIYILGVKDNFRGNQLCEDLIKLRFHPHLVWGYNAASELERTILKSLYKNEKSIKERVNRELSFGEIACYEGHLRILKEFSRSKEDFALILEEDAILQHPNLNLSSIVLPSGGKYLVQLYGNTSQVNEIEQSQIFKLKRRLVPLPGTYAYIISREAAMSFINQYNKTGIDGTIDWPHYFVGQTKLYQTKVNFFTHNSNVESRIGLRADDNNQSSSIDKALKALNQTMHFVSLVFLFKNVLLGYKASDLLKYMIKISLHRVHIFQKKLVHYVSSISGIQNISKSRSH